MIKHEIISFNSLNGSIQVKYFSNEVPEGLVYNIDLPIENGEFSSEQEINQLIELYKPTVQLERLAAIKIAQIPQYLLDKVLSTPIIIEESNEQGA